MAQLKDSIVSGNLRVTDETLTDSLQVTTINAPTAAGGSTYGAGTNGQVLKSNGTSTYWGDDSSGSPSTTVTAVSSSASAGTATTYSRGDHTHNISVATGDANGQVKIAGQNASVKGLGDAAYKGVTDNSSSTAVTSTDTNLITGRTLYYAGYTKNTGTVTGSGLTADTVILGNGGTAIKTSSKTIASSGTGITDDDTKIPTSKSVKSYVDGLVANATHFKGGFAASGDGAIDGGSTTLKSVAESIGDMYTCITAGTIYGIAFEVGDSIIFKKAVAAGTAPATASGTPLASTDFITVEGETSVSVVDNNPTLSWSTQSKVATIEGTEINVTMPANPNTDTSVTSSDNHYTPSTVSGEDKTANASGATAAWSIDVVKGVTLNTDGKGHVTGLSVTSGKIPSNPNTNTIPSAYCNTAAATAAKAASCTDYALLNNSWLHVLIKNSNTSANALTLSVNSKTAKPIYINGSASSSTNYTLPAGTYLVYYDGTNYYFRTDGKLTADITGNADTATKLGTSNKGSSTKPIYLSGGVPTECDSYPTSLPASNTTNTYSSTGTAPVSGTAVAAALGTLDGNLNNTTPSSGKTLTAFSQTDGIVSATFGDISITKSQVSDFPSTMTPSSHTHGNIQNGGTLQTTDVAIASGDKLVVTDSSDSNKIARTSVSFDGSTATKCLTQKGTWESFTNNAGTVTGSSLTANNIILGNGSSAIKSSGKTIATSVTNVDTTVPTSKAVKTYVDTGVSNIYDAFEYMLKSGGSTTFNMLSTIYDDNGFVTRNLDIVKIPKGTYIIGIDTDTAEHGTTQDIKFYNSSGTLVYTLTINPDTATDFKLTSEVTFTDDIAKIQLRSYVTGGVFIVFIAPKKYFDLMTTYYNMIGETFDPFYGDKNTKLPSASSLAEEDNLLRSINTDVNNIEEYLEIVQPTVESCVSNGCKNKINLATGQTLDVTGYGIHCWIDPASGLIHLDGIFGDKKCTGSFNIQVCKTSLMDMVIGETYHFSCDGYETSNTTLGLYIYTSGATPASQFDTFATNEAVWNAAWNNDSGTTGGGVRLFIREGTVVSNVTLRPMICEKFLYDTSSGFEPYALSNKVLTPQAVDCVNSGTKNLLDCSVEKLKADSINNGGTYGYTWSGNICTSSRGAYFIVNKDGSITVVATSTTGDIWFRLAQGFIFSEGSYIMNGCPAGGSTSSYMIESDFLNARDTGSGTTIDRNTPYSDNIYIVVKSGQTLNLTFKPMLCRKEKYSISPVFEPHHITDTSRRNLLNFTSIKRDNSKYGTSVLTEGVRFTLNPDGTVLVNRESASSNLAYVCLCSSGYDILDIGGFCDGRHVLSGCPADGSDSTYRVYAAKGSYAAYDTGTGVLLPSSSEKGINIVIAIYSGYAVSNLLFKPMICTVEEWRETTEFTPKTLDNQTLTPAVINAVDNGAKNLCSTSSGSATAQWINVPLVIDPGVYMLSIGNLASTDTDATTCQIGLFDSSWTNILGSYPQMERGVNVSKRLVVGSKSAVLRIYSSDTSAHGSGDTLTFKNLMVCKESDFNVSQAYQPYALPNSTITPAAIKAVDDGTKNYLVLTDTAMTTTNGVTITYNGDGTYTLNGTATAYGYFYIARSSANPLFKKGSIISGCTGGSSSTFYFAISSTSIRQEDTPIVLESDISASLIFSFYSGVTFSNKIIKPMMCSQEDWNVSQEFKPQALSNPIITPAIVKYVNNSTKNLLCLDIPTMKTLNTGGTWNGNVYQFRGVTYTINSNGSGTITTSGTSDSGSNNSYLHLINFSGTSFIGNTYVFSGCPSGGNYASGYALYVNESPDAAIEASKDTGNGATCTLPSGTQYYRLLVRPNVNMNGKTFKPMICTVSDYAVSKDFVKYTSSDSIMHDSIQISLSSLTWTASASGLYYSEVIPMYSMSKVWMVCLSGFANLRASDVITPACRRSGGWYGFTLWANTNSFVSGAWVTVSVLGI